jgi:hypothetical protein
MRRAAAHAGLLASSCFAQIGAEYRSRRRYHKRAGCCCPPTGARQPRTTALNFGEKKKIKKKIPFRALNFHSKNSDRCQLRVVLTQGPRRRGARAGPARRVSRQSRCRGCFERASVAWRCGRPRPGSCCRVATRLWKSRKSTVSISRLKLTHVRRYHSF